MSFTDGFLGELAEAIAKATLPILQQALQVHKAAEKEKRKKKKY